MKSFLRLAAVVLGLALAGPWAGAASLTSKPGPDAARYAGQYAEMKKASWRSGFPNMGRYEVLAPSTGREDRPKAYNCIAHTLRIYHKWVWPGSRVADFDRLYGEHGYRRARGLDYRFQPGLDRIVLYGKIHADGRVECTHGTRQLADGTWTSKLGGGPLIRHETPESLNGPSYGRPVAVYVRQRKAPGKPGPTKPSRPNTVVTAK